MTELLESPTPASVTQELCEMGLRQTRGETLPPHSGAPTSIFRAGDMEVRINRIEDGYLIDVIDDHGKKIHEESASLDEIVSAVTRTLGDGLLTQLRNASQTSAVDVAAPGSLALVSLQCSINDSRSQAKVVLSIRGAGGEKQETFEGEGEGAIEAICNAINRGTRGIVVRFASLNIVSKASGADAQGAAAVRIGVGHQNFEAEVVHHNIVRATAEAYVAAMNQAIQARLSTDVVS